MLVCNDRIPHKQDQQAELQLGLPPRDFKGFLSNAWRISQWPPHKANQHQCSQPQHGRVEEPFLMRVRHCFTNRHNDPNQAWVRPRTIPSGL